MAEPAPDRAATVGRHGSGAATRVATVSGPALPGGVGVTHVRVYDTVAPDGLAGGTPHLHTVCSEAYLVLRGEGEVQTLSAAGFERTPLLPGTTAWFSPGTVHRLVNLGDLEVFVVMSHAGLPEAGDLVIAFDEETLADAERYSAAAALAESTERRDAAVAAFGDWTARFDHDVDEAMAALHSHAARIVGPRSAGWGTVVRDSTGVEFERSLDWVEQIRAGNVDHLAGAAVAHQPEKTEGRGWGCCGTLGAVVTQ